MDEAYVAAAQDKALCQGDILTGVAEYHVNVESFVGGRGLKLDKRVHPYAIVAAQDCDLDQDYRSRHELASVGDLPEKKRKEHELRKLSGVLLLQAVAAEELRYNGVVNRSIWDGIKKNSNRRYQFMAVIPSSADLRSEGLPELVIDFKRYFTVPTDELYAQLADSECQKRTSLRAPYPQHLSHRFTSYLGRVGLPSDYQSE